MASVHEARGLRGVDAEALSALLRTGASLAPRNAAVVARNVAAEAPATSPYGAQSARSRQRRQRSNANRV